MSNCFLTNRSEVTFLNKIKLCLKRCRSFKLSVSFIKKAGLVLLQQEIIQALERGASGQIITSGYQNFTDISSLEIFNNWQRKYPNFSCHFDLDSFGDDGFHCKGYLFEGDKDFEMIVGSSNITRFALLKNVEWDVSLSDKERFSSFNDSLIEFDVLWKKTAPLTDELIRAYQTRLAYAIEKWDMDYVSSMNGSSIRPNYMQKMAMKDIRRYRDMGATKALVVAATGSGKTYLAAFDALNYGAKRLLYIVHRESILVDARKSFIKVFSNKKLTFGLYTGDKKELDCDFIFATNSEMSRHLEIFDPKEFDYIILDECHHSTADSYQKIIQYFQPSFLLGLTATPDRMDNKDVLQVFDKNIPYQLSIADALNNDLIVPFKYYAIRDEYVDYSLDKTDYQLMINQIVSPENCAFVDEQIKSHLPVNGKLKAIGFCRNIQHAQLMSQRMNDLGYHTTYLTGNNDTGERIESFKELSDESDPLQIIFAVDVLNEGVDVPAMNMVLFLRPTQSQTIFIQQLGRGLRKYEGKNFLTVLDFIGNSYQRSVQIALALSSLKPNSVIEKPALCALVTDNFRQLDLPIEVFFDEKSKEEILNYISRTNFNSKDFLKGDYLKFKDYLHSETYPSHMDYLNDACAPDLMRFINSRVNGTVNGCYYNFLKKMEEENITLFTKDEVEILVDLSQLLPLIRPDDYSIFLSLLSGDKNADELAEDDKKYGIFKSGQFENALRFLEGKLYSDNEQFSKKWLIVKNDNGLYHLDSSSFSDEFREHLLDLLNYGLERFRSEYGMFEGDLSLYGNYTTSQIMMALNQKKLQYMKGTMYDGEHGVLFVGLKKDSSISERLKYADKFLSADVFQWESEVGCDYYSAVGKKVLKLKKVSLFIRKVKEEDGIRMPYLYVGEGRMTNPRLTSNPGKTLLFDIILDHRVDIRHRDELLVPEKNEGEEE